MAKIEITMDEVYTFLQCPLKYQMQCINGIETAEHLTNGIIVSKGIHETIYHFYKKLQQGKMLTLKQTRDRFGKYYYDLFDHDKVTTKNILLARNEIDRRRQGQIFNKGIEAAHHFYNENKDNPGVPIAFNYPFRIALTDDIILTGEFELVREMTDEDGRKFIEVVDFKTSSPSTNDSTEFFLRHDLRATAMFYAFEKQFGSKPDRFIFDYIGSDTKLVLHRDNNEIKRLEKVLKGIVNAIENNDFYPRQTFMCKSCSMRDYCDRIQF